MNTPLNLDETERLKSLSEYEILDTPPQQVFDDLTDLAAVICDTPMALISFVDADRQWFKSKVGTTLSETKREDSICLHTIKSKEMLVIENVSTDSRFSNNLLVTGYPKIKFYAGAPLISEKGYALGSLCVLDFQPRKLSEVQTRLLKVLAGQVMQNLELRRLQKVRFAKVNIMNDMASVIAHEINNPLTIINSHATLIAVSLEQEMFNQKFVVESAKKIINAVKRISKIITNLKEISLGERTVAVEEVRLVDLIDESISYCKERVDEHQIDLRVQCLCDMNTMILCRSVQISQVLLNLLNNAIDGICDLPEKWIQLRVEAELDKIKFSVMDSGHGIEPDILAKIFTPFFTTKGVGKGSGLGLSISKEILEMHHGTLIYDEHAPHTCFVLSIPKKQ